MNRIAVAVAVLFVAALLVACSGPSPVRDEDPTSSPTTSPGSPPSLEKPGLYDLDDGRTSAIGTLEYRRLEGGFWAVVDRSPGQEVENARVIAVVVNATEVAEPQTLEGEYVAAEGRLLDGVSIRMAGPELRADSLRRLEGSGAAPR